MKTFSNPQWLDVPGNVRLRAEVLLEAGDKRRPVLPCPFCASKHMTILNALAPCFKVACDNCSAEVHGLEVAPRGDGLYQTRKAALAGYRRAFKSAINAWNRRA